MMKYKILYSIYGCENIINFQCFSQYMNWIVVMEENFKEQFVIHEIQDLEFERKKNND